MGARIIDNDRLKLAHSLVELAPKYKHLSIATGYWDLLGYKVLLDALKDYESIRLIIGQEPLAPRHAKALNIYAPEETFPDLEIRESLQESEHEDSLRDTVIEIKRLIELGRLEVRVFRGDFLHAKTYIFGNHQSNDAVGIIGSSNFTGAGLTKNRELNALEDDSKVVRYEPKNSDDEHGHLSWFDELWNDPRSENWSGKFAEILETSPVGDITYSPYEMYIRALYELYGADLVPEVEYEGTTNEVLFEFQQRNANLLLSKLRRYGLAMLADSVGLGKTITAGEVIRNYLEERGARRIYVVAPANLTEQWRNDLQRVHGLFSGYHVISMQDIGRIQKERLIDEYAGVDLFIVDEAHNLRSGAGSRHDELLDWFSDNVDSHVLLLTATPINNSLKDFVNQIQLAAKGRLESFPVVYPTANKTETLDFFDAVQRLTTEANKAEKKGEKPDYKKANSIMRQGLSRYLVRTTRQGIEREFGGIKSSDGQIQKFPQSVVKPAPYTFDPQLMDEISQIIKAGQDVFEGNNPTELSIDSLLEQTQRTRHPLDQLAEVSKSNVPVSTPFESIFQALLLLGFAPYKSDVYRHRYYGKTSDEIRSFKIPAEESFRLTSQMSVHNMLRVVLLKRLESSQYALRRSLENYLEKLNDFEEVLNSGFVIRLKDLRELRSEYEDDFEFLSDGDVAEEIAEKREVADPKVFNIEALKQDLKRDRAILTVLFEMCDALGRDDDKLNAFARLIQGLQNSNSGTKVLIFSYFADTIEYLKRALPEKLSIEDFNSRAAFTTGANKREIEQLARRFSPKSKSASEVTSEDELNYLFSTDVLSEGQNLQDCGLLVNYDLHWNPVRMIQRNGRINRLGSSFSEVQIFNMHPDVNLDVYLSLVERLERKIERIANTVGTDSSILGELENPIEYIVDLYDEQNASAAFAVLDDDQELLSEDEYIRDLREFEKTATELEKEQVRSIPTGKWGYFPEKGGMVPKQIQSLGLVKVTGTASVDNAAFQSHIFVSTTDTHQPVETIEALKMIRAPKGKEGRMRDLISLDRNLIRRRSEKIAEKHARTTPTFFKITASPSRVLDKLVELRPEVQVRVALNKITTKSELKTTKRLFNQAARELRQGNVLSPQTVEGFVELTERLETKPAVTKTPDDARGLLFYGK